MDLARDVKRSWNKNDKDTNCNLCAWNDLEYKRTSRDYPNHSIVKVGQNTEKCTKRLEETCCHTVSSEKPSANAGVENSPGIEIIIIWTREELQVNQKKRIL